MVRRLLHRLVGHSWVYDTVQSLAGATILREKIARRLNNQPEALRVLDLGGGTGVFAAYIPPGTTYICADIDEAQLDGFKKRHPGGDAVLANGCTLPFPASHVDSVILMSVLRHLNDGEINQVFHEVQRILTSSGRLYILDPVWNQKNWVGKWLWKYDRGSYPRSQGRITNIASHFYAIVFRESFKIFHEYIFLECTKR